MLYSDIQNNFQSILNRRDITPSQVTTFIGMAIQRIQRDLRIPAMETQTSYVMGGLNGVVPVPGDYLEMIAITFNDNVNQKKLSKTDFQTAIRLGNIPGIPAKYYRSGGSFLIGPYPSLVGTVCYISYYQDATSLVNPTDHNWLTDAAPDLLIYGALCMASDFYLDERADKFEARFSSIMSSLQLQAFDDELENASISPAYSDNNETYGSYNYGVQT